MSDRTHSFERWCARLRATEEQLTQLEAKARRIKAGAKPPILTDVAEARRRQAEVRKKLDELRTSGEDGRVELETGIEDAWNSLGAALDRVRSRFPAKASIRD